jgi:hypothetical protein
MKRIVLYTLIVIMAAACEKTVKIDVPKKDPKLVIHGLVTKGYNVTVHIGKSRGVLEPDNFTVSLQEQYTVKNAVVALLENGVSIDTLVYRANDFAYYSPRNRVPRDGAVYMIRATAPGFMAAEATSDVPSQSVIAGVVWNKNVRVNGSGFSMDDITIKINDPASEKNFYMVQVISGRPYSNYNAVYCVSTADKDVEQSMAETDPLDPDNCYDGSKLLMKDVNFNGMLKQLKLSVESGELATYTDPSNGTIYRPHIKVLRITEDRFRFVKSMDAYDAASENPFAEPANVFTNVRNGYGIFSISTVAVDTLR